MIKEFIELDHFWKSQSREILRVEVRETMDMIATRIMRIQPFVWSVSDQSGKRVQRTGWKALLTSETAMQLRAARPMCGSGTLVEILMVGSSLIARSPFHDRCIRVPCDVKISPIRGFASRPLIAIKFNDLLLEKSITVNSKLIPRNKCSFEKFSTSLDLSRLCEDGFAVLFQNQRNTFGDEGTNFIFLFLS